MPPEGVAVARRWDFLATELVKVGAHVSVLCRAHQRDPRAALYEVLEIPGSSTSNRLGLFRRALGELVFAVRSALKLRRLDFDVVLISTPFVPLLLARTARRGRPLVVEIRDLAWEYVPDTPQGRLAGAVFRWIAAGGVRASAAVVATTQGQVDAARELARGRGDRIYSCVRNGADPSGVPLVDAAPADEPVVTYCGNLGIPQGLESFVRAAALAPEWRFVLVGDGAEDERLREVAARLGVGNVEFRGRVAAEAVASAYAEARVLFAGLRSDPVYSVTIPSKIYECMAANRPLVYAGAGEAAAIVERSGGGIVVPPESPEDIARALGELESRSRVDELAAAGLAFVRGEGSRDAGAVELQRVLTEVLAG